MAQYVLSGDQIATSNSPQVDFGPGGNYQVATYQNVQPLDPDALYILELYQGASDPITNGMGWRVYLAESDGAGGFQPTGSVITQGFSSEQDGRSSDTFFDFGAGIVNLAGFSNDPNFDPDTNTFTNDTRDETGDGQMSIAELEAGQTFVICFAEGTSIATAAGERPVESLTRGDLVLTADGRSVPVKWMGRRTYMRRFTPADRYAPVRIAAGALGEGLPFADLRVSVDHGLLVEGAICHAGALVNGTTIRQLAPSEVGETITYWHVETEGHEIILANGTQAETFIDNVRRQSFENYGEYVDLYGAVQEEMAEMPIPRALTAGQVPARVRALIAGRAAVADGGQKVA